ncbi:MAG: right-handed parallel beta-helix repeat-containing protein [Planctomycetes bacterium]|nr:right-handed parallel beta-helix repeat-containing protein [Planctomycetota bacterium]
MPYLHHRMSIGVVTVAWSLAVLAVLSGAARAQTIWYVDDSNPNCPGSGTLVDPYCAIQDGIDAASNGDEVIVAAGTYNETINFLGRAITLRSATGPNVTTIDGTGHFHVVQCVSGEGPDTVLDGFTITGGNAHGTFQDHQGGGMLNSASSPTVMNCIFSGNTAGAGGGMLNSASNPTVMNCIFSGNTAFTAFFSGFGGGMWNQDSSPIISNCTFTGNSVGCCGEGGAIYNFNSSPTVTNCILWGNTPNEITDGEPAAKVRYSDVQGGWPGTGNIDLDPLFVDPINGDFRLQRRSPAIDAGNNWAIAGITDTDLRGSPRFVHASTRSHPGCGEPAVVDMGAFEAPGKASSIKRGDIDGNGIVGMLDLVILASSWGLCAPRGCCLADFDLDGRVAVPDLLTVLRNWG